MEKQHDSTCVSPCFRTTGLSSVNVNSCVPFFIVSQLQAELDNMNQHLVFTQGLSEDLRSNVKAMKNAKHKVGAEKTQAEEQKLKQVDRLKSGTFLDSLTVSGFIID